VKEKVRPIMKGNTAVGWHNNEKLHVLVVPFVSRKTLYSEPNFCAVFSFAASAAERAYCPFLNLVATEPALVDIFT
jgi:hypothetical protein